MSFSLTSHRTGARAGILGRHTLEACRACRGHTANDDALDAGAKVVDRSERDAMNAMVVRRRVIQSVSGVEQAAVPSVFRFRDAASRIGIRCWSEIGMTTDRWMRREDERLRV